MAWNFFNNTGSIKTIAVPTKSSVISSYNNGNIAITNNAVNSCNSNLVYSSGTPRGIYSMSGGTQGSIVTLSAGDIAVGEMLLIKHNSGNILLRDSVDFGLYKDESITFQYSGSYWIEVYRDVKTILSIVPLTTNANITYSSTADAPPSSYPFQFNSITFDGATPIQIFIYIPEITTSNLSNTFLSLYNNTTSTSLGKAWGMSMGALTGATGMQIGASISTRLTPSIGATQYYVGAYTAVSGGTSTIFAGAGGTGTFTSAYSMIKRSNVGISGT